MLKSEIAVLEKHHDLSPGDQAIRRERLLSLHRDLIVTLLNEGATGEAKSILRELSVREGRIPFSLFERIVIGASPAHYASVRKQADRIKDSFAYRIKRPLKHLTP